MADAVTRRSLFGMFAGLFCLPLVKPRHHKRTKYFDIPDDYDWLRLIDCKEPGHVLCYDSSTIDLAKIHEHRRRFNYTWECLFEGHKHFFRVHTSKPHPRDQVRNGFITINEWRAMDGRNG